MRMVFAAILVMLLAAGALALFMSYDDTETFLVGPTLVDCVGVAPQKCMMVRHDEASDWELFYSDIEGFDYEEGNSYRLSVRVTDVPDPPADSSSKRYELVSILEQTPEP